MKFHLETKLSWFLISIPSLIVQINLLTHILLILYKNSRKLIILTNIQYFIAISYVLSLNLAIFSLIFQDFYEFFQFPSIFGLIWTEINSNNELLLSKQLWLLSLIIFLINYYIIIYIESENLIQTKGYELPFPLIHSRKGWITSIEAENVSKNSHKVYEKNKYMSILLGTIKNEVKPLYEVVMDEM